MEVKEKSLVIKPNAQQQMCIDSVDGKFLVLAGPGTGKTFTVTRRIKHMVEDLDIEPSKILCLTFSNTAAREMKNKIGQSYDVDIYTYHEFCLDIIKSAEDEFGTLKFKIITDSIKRNLIKECIDELDPKAYNNEKNNPYMYIQNILDGIEEIKKNRLNKQEFFYNLQNNPLWEKHLSELQEQQKEKFTKTRQNEIEKLIKKIDRMKELWSFYELYTLKMQSLNYIDFFDMINLVLDEFERENSILLEEVAGKYQYILVDEYQDTNKAQNDIVFNLAKHCPNVFVVGDDDQIIYTFQGAKLDTIENFINKFPDVKVVCLKENNRSTQNILDVSQEIAKLQDKFCQYKAEKATTKKDKEFWASNKVDLRVCSNPKFKQYNITKDLVTPQTSKFYGISKPIEYYAFEQPNDERNYIIHKIKKLVNSENRPERLSDIAILTKTNEELEKYEIFLKANGIPVEITGGKNIFNITAVNVLITYMQFLINPELYSDKLLSFLLLNPFHINPRDYMTLWEYKNHHKSLLSNITSLLEKNTSSDEILSKIEYLLKQNSNTVVDDIRKALSSKNVQVYDSEKLKNFIETYEYLRNYIVSENYANAILEIGNKTGIFQYYVNDNLNRMENVKGIQKLLDEADSYFTVHNDREKSFVQFVDYLTKMLENDIEINLDKEDKPLDAVQLSTYHSSKGREFEYVFMPNLTSNKWESSSSSYKEEIPLSADFDATFKELDEKQTQAKFLDNIKLLYVGMTRAKHSLILSCPETGARDGKLSWFIEQLRQNINLEGMFVSPEKEEIEHLEIITTDYNYKEEFGDFIKSRTQTSFSPSSLNMYRKCPRQYFYNYILGLRYDAGNKDSAGYGRALHSAFEFALNYAMEHKKYPTVDEAYTVFEKEIDSMPVINPDKIKQSAKEHIFCEGLYYQKFIEIKPAQQLDTQTELKVTWESENGISFNGSIDRVDKNPDGSYTIYDYKTGEDSNGITKGGAHSDYYYQMAFYKYLFQNHLGTNAPIHTVFLYPLIDASYIDMGLDDAKCEEVANEYIEIVNKINNFEFCKPEKCPKKAFCNCRDFCKNDVI